MRSLALAPVAPVTVASSSASASASARRGGSARPQTLPQSRRLAALGNRAARRGSSRRLAASASDESASPYYSEGAAGPEDVDSLLELYLSKASSRSNADKRGPTPPVSDAGKVYLVGTGPGDPGLLTLKAFHLMQTADVVLYDRLVSNEILNLARAEARMVYVGKRAGYHTRTQEEIHELLAAFADAGATILRLKGGDPLVFGRGGEEFEFLREHNPNVRVEVVPGITAAAGVGSELGIPLTHRGVATSVRLLTGHLREGAGSREDATGAASDPVDFAVTSADVETTLVVYMGLGTLPKLSEKLIASGFPADMPAVAIERGTTVDERRVFSSIEHLPEAAAACELVSPTLLIVGRTVTLSPHWPYAADESSYDPKWVEQRGSPRAAEDVDDWRAWLDLDVDFASSRPRAVAREIHVDAF